MSFSAEGVAAIIVALAGLISGLYNLMQARRVQAVQDLDKMEKTLEQEKEERRNAERLLEVAMRHIHALNLSLARAGIDGVPLPKELS